ncbi:unnamed protein product [Ectocarpus sp. 8 AP-2014]
MIEASGVAPGRKLAYPRPFLKKTLLNSVREHFHENAVLPVLCALVPVITIAGEELPAVAASLLFSVHPVHVEAVAPIVGRADLLCGFLSVIALSLAIKGTSSKKQRQSRNIGLQSPDRGELEDHQQEQSSRRPPCYFGSGSSSSSSSSSPVEIDESFRDLGLAPTIRGGEQEVVQLKSKPGESVVLTAGQSRQGNATEATATKVVPHTGTQGLATSLSTTGPSPTSSAAAGGEKPIGFTTEEATYLTAACTDVGMPADTGTLTTVAVDNSDNEGETFVTPALHCESSVAKTQEPEQNLRSGNNDLSSLNDTPGDDAGRTVAAEASVESSNDATSEARGSIATMETMKPAAIALEAPLRYVSSKGYNDEGEATAVHGRALVMEGSASCPPSPMGFNPAMTSNMVPGKGAPSMRSRAAIVMKEKDSGPGVTRYCAALLFAASATLCKEVGITVFGLMAGGEVVRFFEEREWRQRKRKLWQRRRSGIISTAGKRVIWRRQALREYWRCRFMMRVPAAAAARVVSATIFAVLLVYLHVRLHEGARVREWGVLENDISILPRWVRSGVAYAPLHNL